MGQDTLVFCDSPENPTVKYYYKQRRSVFAMITMSCEKLTEVLQLIVLSIG